MKEQIKSWVKINKNSFTKNFIKNYSANNSTHTAFFMAGVPGAGKTEFSKNLLETIEDGNILRLDMDDIASKIKGYTPEKADQFRGGATILLSRIFDLIINKKIDFLMDGTFGTEHSVQNVERAMKAGYVIKIFFVIQDPKIAWNFTKQREIIEHRTIKIDGFINTFFNIPKNIINIMHREYDKISIDIITKNSLNKIETWERNISLEKMLNIDEYKIKCYNKKSLLEKLG